MGSIDSFAFLPFIRDRLEDDLASAAHKMFTLIADMSSEEQKLSLSKDSLIAKLEMREGKIEDANFRKRISQINKALTDLKLGLSLENTKTSVNLKFDKELLQQLAQQVTRAQLKSRGDEEYVDESRLVVSMASSSPMAKLDLQVLVSYAWDASADQLAMQRNFAKRLEAALVAPPSKYQSLPSVKVFLDVSENGFQLGESQLEQQNAACENSQVCVLMYTNKYLKSISCQKEANYFLTDEGKSRSGKLIIVAPFSVVYSEMADRYKQNVAATPENYPTVLSLLENGTETEKNNYINKIAAKIFSHYQSHLNTVPAKTSHDQMRTALRNSHLDIESCFCEVGHAKESLSGQNADAIPIVDCMKSWALSMDEEATRIFYLLGDFGAGKSTSCQLLTKELLNEYESSSRPETERVLPIYLDLKKLLNAFANVEKSLESPIENLIEEMLRKTGSDNIKGSEVVSFIRANPSLIIFDGFDEVGQKLTESQQVGLLNKILDLVPREVYSTDLKRLVNPGHIYKYAPKFPRQTRILISCRTHFFNSVATEQAFKKGFYRSEAGMQQGEIKNYVNYYLVPFTKEQIKNYLKNWLGDDQGERAADFIETVHDLSGLSEQPIMLRLIKDLIPSLEEKSKYNQRINAATLYNVLFEQVGQRDAEKHLIGLDEKQQLLASFAVYLWQIQSTDINREMLKEWFLDFKSQLPIMSTNIVTGKYSIDLLLQDLHNASLLVRNGEDSYRFAHTSFYEYFLACGLFELVRKADTNLNTGFDIWGALEGVTVNHETIQFLLDWRQTSNSHYRKQFDTKWQVLQQQNGNLWGRKIGFDIWSFAFLRDQDFSLLISPNWSQLKIENFWLQKGSSDKLNLINANFSNCHITESNFEGVNFANANFCGTALRQNNFEYCNFNGAQFDGLRANANNFMDCLALDDWWHYLETRSQHVGLNFIMSKEINSESVGLISARLNFVKDIHATCMAVSPDDSIVSIGHNKIVRLLDVATQNFIIDLKGHAGSVTCIAFSPDGKILVSAGDDCVINFWNVSTQCCVASLDVEGHSGKINSVAFSPDGKVLTSAGNDNLIKLWDVATQNCIASIQGHESFVKSIIYNPDGKTFISFGDDETIKLWDVAEHSCIASFDMGGVQVKSAAYSPDGKFFVSGGYDGIIKLWDVTTLSCKANLETQCGMVKSLVYSPDGKTLVSVGQDEVIRFWDVATQSCIGGFEGNPVGTECVIFSFDGKLLFSAGSYQGIKFWDAVTWDCISNLKTHLEWIILNRYSSHGEILASAGDDEGLRLWDLKTQRCIANLRHGDWVTSVAFSPDGKNLVSVGGGNIKLWDLVTLHCVAIIEECDSNVFLIAFNPDGKTFASMGSKTIEIWDVATQSCIANFEAANDWIACFEYSPDGKVLASVMGEAIVLWSVAAQRCIARLEGHVGEISSIAYSPDGKILASSGNNDFIKLWDLEAHVCIGDIEGHSGGVNSVSYSPDGKTLVSTGRDQSVKFWDVATFDCINSFENVDASNALFDKSGEIVIIASTYDFALWDIASGEKLWSAICFPDATATISADSSPICLQGKAWKYFTSVSTTPEGSVFVAPPTTHPRWKKTYKLQ